MINNLRQKGTVCSAAFSILFLLNLSACDMSGQNNRVLGTLERERVLLTAVASKEVIDISCQVGAHVKKGDRLLQLKDESEQAEVTKAKASLMEAEAMLLKLQNGARSEDVASAEASLLSAKANLNYAKKSFERLQDLMKKKNASQADLDKTKAEYDSAQAKYNEAHEFLLKLTNGSRPEDIMQASAQVLSAQAQIKIAQNVVNNLNVRATRNGTVEALPWHVGERVSQGAPVVVLIDDGAPFVRAYIPEPLRVKLKIAGKVKVKIDGIKQLFEGKIKQVASQPSFTPYYGLNAHERSRLVYLAEVTLLNVKQDLPSGLPVEIIVP